MQLRYPGEPGELPWQCMYTVIVSPLMKHALGRPPGFWGCVGVASEWGTSASCRPHGVHVGDTGMHVCVLVRLWVRTPIRNARICTSCTRP